MASIVRRWRGQAGQAMLETVLTMGLVILFIFGLLHLTMMITTKYLVNYAAFAGARVAMLRGSGAPEVVDAAHQAMEIWRWWPRGSAYNTPDVWFDAERGGVAVRYRVPFVAPIFPHASGLWVEGFAPSVEQPAVEEKGDNAR